MTNINDTNLRENGTGCDKLSEVGIDRAINGLLEL